MKNVIIVGFKEKPEVVSEIDRLAEAEGLNRSGFLRQIIRDKLRSME
jgi:metal-responsive CopG/Arc/MetJ family transcriptional regulator